MGRHSVFDIDDGVLKKYRGRSHDVTIPLYVTEIGERAFEGCAGLRSVTILRGVRKIGDYAFSGCADLKTVAIPDTVTDVGPHAFLGCRGLEDRDGFVVIRGVLYGYAGNKGDEEVWEETEEEGVLQKRLCGIVIPEGVVRIQGEAFYGCWRLKEVTIPGSVSQIGNQAFYGCRNLTAVRIASEGIWIGDRAFAECDCLGSVTASEAVGEEDKEKRIERSPIGDWVFEGCQYLTEVRLPEDLAFMGEGVFSGCFSLGLVRIPAGVEMISDPLMNVFAVCSTPYAAAHVRYPIYAGGSPSDLSPDRQADALRGYVFARYRGIRELDRWREDYMSLVTSRFRKELYEEAFGETGVSKDFLLFLVREGLLGREETRELLDLYARLEDLEDPEDQLYYAELDMELKAALLQYQEEKFGASGPEDLVL